MPAIPFDEMTSFVMAERIDADGSKTELLRVHNIDEPAEGAKKKPTTVASNEDFEAIIRAVSPKALSHSRSNDGQHSATTVCLAD